MRPECGLHRKRFVYDDEDDPTKCIVLASWTFTYDVGQWYYMYCVSRAMWDFTHGYQVLDLSREEYLGQMFRPEDTVAKSDLPEVEQAHAHDSSRYGISRCGGCVLEIENVDQKPLWFTASSQKPLWFTASSQKKTVMENLPMTRTRFTVVTALLSGRTI